MGRTLSWSKSIDQVSIIQRQTPRELHGFFTRSFNTYRSLVWSRRLQKRQCDAVAEPKKEQIRLDGVGCAAAPRGGRGAAVPRFCRRNLGTTGGVPLVIAAG